MTADDITYEVLPLEEQSEGILLQQFLVTWNGKKAPMAFFVHDKDMDPQAALRVAEDSMKKTIARIHKEPDAKWVKEIREGFMESAV